MMVVAPFQGLDRFGPVPQGSARSSLHPGLASFRAFGPPEAGPVFVVYSDSGYRVLDEIGARQLRLRSWLLHGIL